MKIFNNKYGAKRVTTITHHLTPITSGLLLLMMTSCADEFDFWGFKSDRPGTDAQYEYLKDYNAIKTYIDRSAHPTFKAGLALDAAEYDNGTEVYAVANTNFDEIVAGNAMKMASCVSDKGVLDFTTVTNFVNTASEAGMPVYGHTLAWHSQQPVKWLTSLLADKPMETKGTVTKSDYDLDCADLKSYSWTGSPATVTTDWNQDGAMVITNPSACANFWDLQYWLVNGISLTEGATYKLTITCKAEGSSDANIRFKLGDWGGGYEKQFTIPANDGYHEISFDVTPTMASNGLFFQHGDYVGKIYWKSMKITHEEAASVEVPQYLYDNEFTSGSVPGGWGNNSTREIVEEDGKTCIKLSNPSSTNFWSAQMAIDYGTAFESGKTYYMHLRVKGTGDGTLRSGFQITSDYSSALDFANVAFTSEWKDVTLKATCSKDDATRWIFSFGDFAGDIYLSDLQLYWMKSMNTQPLTDQEKKDTLTYAMNTWVSGMMNATQGKVSSWDLVNEALSGADMDGDGKYDLQHSGKNADGTWDVGGDAFYWQDYLGDEDYPVIVSDAARKYFVEAGGNEADLKLFINDYNLESTWDNNKKLESLIEWIKIWKAKGAKIDGIGTQMHISYYMDAARQKSQEEHITRMFQLIAQTGLLCRVSELDMGIVDEDGNTILTSDMTFEQEKLMADYYQWIIEQYMDIIPQAQQYGITQWCATDSPAGSGWRAGEPVGLWTVKYQRKPSYGGWCEGLKK